MPKHKKHLLVTLVLPVVNWWVAKCPTVQPGRPFSTSLWNRMDNILDTRNNLSENDSYSSAPGWIRCICYEWWNQNGGQSIRWSIHWRHGQRHECSTWNWRCGRIQCWNCARHSYRPHHAPLGKWHANRGGAWGENARDAIYSQSRVCPSFSDTNICSICNLAIPI